jgi:hypothetical protein
MLKHFVVTRLGLGVSSERWFERMIDLFEAVTFASLSRQTSQEFTWLVTVDAAMPANSRKRLEALLSSHPNYRVLAIDVTRLTRMQLGCSDWIWDHCQRYILEADLLTDPCDYIITSLIDADDAWHREVTSIINRFIAGWLPLVCLVEEKRSSRVRHSCGMAVTFPKGLKWFIPVNAIEPMEYSFNSMAVFVAARFSSGISACSSRPSEWKSYCNVVGFDMSELERDRPMWVYARHDRAMQPWDARNVSAVDSSVSDRLDQSFGIDLDKIECWRSKYMRASAGQAPTVHYGTDAAIHQYDHLFRITALNGKIEVLERRREIGGIHVGQQGATCSQDAAIETEIARCKTARALLIETLRSTEPNPS